MDVVKQFCKNFKKLRRREFIGFHVAPDFLVLFFDLLFELFSLLQLKHLHNIIDISLKDPVASSVSLACCFHGAPDPVDPFVAFHRIICTYKVNVVLPLNPEIIVSFHGLKDV